MTVDSSMSGKLTTVDLGEVSVINSEVCDGDELVCHLALALENADDNTCRFHLRQALQLLTADPDETDTTNDV